MFCHLKIADDGKNGRTAKTTEMFREDGQIDNMTSRSGGGVKKSCGQNLQAKPKGKTSRYPNQANCTLFFICVHVLTINLFINL